MKKDVKKCPLMKGKKCMEHDCVYYQPIQLIDKSSIPFKNIEKWHCSTLNKELYLKQINEDIYSMGGAIESMRNEMIKELRSLRTENMNNHHEFLNFESQTIKIIKDKKNERLTYKN